jgi:hypothetical protein
MLNATVVSNAINRMSLLTFFPPQTAWPGLAMLIHDMCSTDEQVEWLARRVVTLYDSWPGPHELRAVLCSRFKPLDGIEADSKHARYIEDGIPSERPEISAPAPKRLTSANASADIEMQSMVASVASTCGARGKER